MGERGEGGVAQERFELLEIEGVRALEGRAMEGADEARDVRE